MERRVHSVSVAAMTPANALEMMRPGTLVITPGDRSDILMAVALATLSGIPLAGLLLSGGLQPDARVLALCEPAFDTGLSLLRAEGQTIDVARSALEMDLDVPTDDRERIELVMNTVAKVIELEAFKRVLARERERHPSPPAFRHMLIERAREANRRIVLPEGDEPRTITAASICASRNIARCVLLGDAVAIRASAERLGVRLDGVEILDPARLIPRYVEPMVELRRARGLTHEMAEEELADRVVLGTMMLKQGDVDGLVSGAVHTTADTVRPAFQLIKTAPDSPLVSSIFFMCLPEGVLVYGDCAVNRDPSAEELAGIAIQSADSASLFGIPARVAMISYSTGASGSGSDVEKVVEATRLAQASRPDLEIDGPLQYDAASVASVARSKAPDSRVAGRATVFIFPDLNTGNTTYKAVQRSAQVVSIGPMLQGLAKPVNDLSRGALVEDIVFTIALTAIQAKPDSAG
jgi:phosphate acetyltransferase